MSNKTANWPEKDLAFQRKCPACASTERQVLHTQLADYVCGIAPGQWTLWRCGSCDGAYLDPRPSEASIGRAYAQYYTHNVEKPRSGSNELSILRKTRRSLANGYINYRYGTNFTPANKWGRFLGCLLPLLAEPLDVQYRWIEKPPVGGRLLDIGCGNGAYLACAQNAGWEVTGIDSDPNAIRVAKQSGINVLQGSLDEIRGFTDYFDVVTISHVIEHLHNPREAFSVINQVLKVGGKLYVDTPNINSRGHTIYGRYWRGLEAPRHLTIFSHNGLLQLLKETGFNRITLKKRRLVTRSILQSSGVLARSHSVEELRSNIYLEILKAYFSRASSNLEFITVLAERSGK